MSEGLHTILECALMTGRPVCMIFHYAFTMPLTDMYLLVLIFTSVLKSGKTHFLVWLSVFADKLDDCNAPMTYNCNRLSLIHI